MALQDKLDRFKKQQERCQTTLTGIAASKSSSTPKFTPAPAAPNGRPPAPAVKFSNDTERLQHINSIRKSPVGAQIKRVIDLLLEVHNPHPSCFPFSQAMFFPPSSTLVVFLVSCVWTNSSMEGYCRIGCNGPRFDSKYAELMLTFHIFLVLNQSKF